MSTTGETSWKACLWCWMGKAERGSMYCKKCRTFFNRIEPKFYKVYDLVEPDEEKDEVTHGTSKEN